MRMHFPADTPATVRQAIQVYSRTWRTRQALAAAAGGLALSGLVILTLIVADRFWEVPVAWRHAGPMLVGALLAATAVLVLVVSFLGLPSPLTIAIRLDRAFPEDQDRWASALDLTVRRAQGEAVGADAFVEQLLAETDSLSHARTAGRTVRKAPVWFSMCCLAGMGVCFLLLETSLVFDLPLLWKRFWDPAGNYPRDSFTTLTLVEINGQAFDGGELPTAPEGNPLSIRVRMGDRRPGREPPVLAPVIEEMADGAPADLICDGTTWLYRDARLHSSLRFRLRAGDALSRVYRLAVISRIRLETISHSIRYPRYTRQDPVLDQPLASGRLAMLVDSRLEVNVTCDQPYTLLEATFEPLQKQAAEPGALSGDGHLTVTRETRQQTDEPHRRPLRIHPRGEKAARFSLRVEESGILRIKATGSNGLPCLPTTCIVDALPDTPPRLTVTGVELDTTIMPGELLAFQYRVEDDLAVADLVLDWWCAGSATTDDLAGSEYISSDDLGTKLVEGQELIQRMNYRIYATQPFEFQLAALDSKGQESRSPKFRVHLIDDDHAARFEAGMEYLRALSTKADTLRLRYRELANQLDIVITAIGGQPRWPASRNALLEDLRQRAGRLSWIYLDRDHLIQRFSGFPHRIDRSASLVGAARRMLPGALLLPHVERLATAERVSERLAALKAEVAEALELNDLIETAAEAEIHRFGPESALQKGRKLRQRLEALEVSRDNPELYEANLRFYLDELQVILKTLVPHREAIPGLGARLEALEQAHVARELNRVLLLLGGLIENLAAYHPPPSPAAVELERRMTELAATTPERQVAFKGNLGGVMRSRGQEAYLPAREIIRLGHWLTAPGALVGEVWFREPPDALGLWLRMSAYLTDLRQFRRDILLGRYDLHPAARLNREAELREHAIAVSAAASTPGLASEQQVEMKAKLAPFTVLGFRDQLGQSESEDLSALAAAWSALGGEVELHDLGDELPNLAACLRGQADHAERHAARVRAFLERTPAKELREALTHYQNVFARDILPLMLTLEGAEAWFRALLYLKAHTSIRSAPMQWEQWRPWHELQLALMWLALWAEERIYGRHYVEVRFEKNLARHTDVTITNCHDLAARLRTCAGLLDRLAAGRTLDHDFGPLIKETRTTGYLPSLEAEHGYVVPLQHRPSRPLSDADLASLRQARLGKVVTREKVLLDVILHRDRLQSISAVDAGALAEAVRAIRVALGSTRDETAEQTLDEALRVLSGAAPGAVSVKRQVHAVEQMLSAAVNRLRGQVRLPPVSTIGRENRRFTSRSGLPFLWTIRALVDHCDRRWVERRRDVELGLVRHLLQVGTVPGATPEARRDLVLQYALLTELRARNLANEQRRSRGISFLEPDRGPALRLPRHIAIEFTKARNRRSPHAFRQRIELYQTDLYRDLTD